jgi:hypothetical protein
MSPVSAEIKSTMALPLQRCPGSPHHPGRMYRQTQVQEHKGCLRPRVLSWSRKLSRSGLASTWTGGTQRVSELILGATTLRGDCPASLPSRVSPSGLCRKEFLGQDGHTRFCKNVGETTVVPLLGWECKTVPSL